MGLIDDYLTVYNDKIKIFGDKLCLLQQKGSFYNFFGIETEDEVTGRPRDIARDGGVVLSRSKKPNGPFDRNSPVYGGFPVVSFESRNLPRLMRCGWTVIVMKEVKSGSKFYRKISETITPSTFISDTESDSKNISCVYLDPFQRNKKQKVNIGLATVNVHTGKSFVYEIVDSDTDPNYLTDELFRFLETYSVFELYVFSKNYKLTRITKDQIKSLIDSSDIHFHTTNSVQETNKWQCMILDKVFGENQADGGKRMGSILDYLGLTGKPLAVISLALLLNHIYSMNESLLYKFAVPEFHLLSGKMILDKNAMFQLNIVPNRMQSYQNLGYNESSFHSVFSVIDKTVTSIGRRFLRNKLLNPVNSIPELKRSYFLIDYFQKLPKESFEQLQNQLKSVMDLERLYRKMAMQQLKPYEFRNIHSSHRAIGSVLLDLLELDCDLSDIGVTEDLAEQLSELIATFEDTVYIDPKDQLIETCFIKPGVDQSLDDIISDMQSKRAELDVLLNELIPLVPGTKKYPVAVKLDKNDNEGYFLTMTKRRFQDLKKSHPHIANKYESSVLTNNVKLKNKQTKDASLAEKNLASTLEVTVEHVFNDILDKIYSQFSSHFHTVTSLVANVDTLLSSAKVANLYRYTCPVISDRESFIKAKQIRHPLVERIQQDTGYIPNDISLGVSGVDGNLLYGINSTGKSCLMKSIGINLILAQAGFFVAAEEFEFSPFDRLLTRISGDDNIFRGQSTFVVEMSELNTILRRSTPNTLVIGDEICHGTENGSGNGLVGASIVHLSKLRAKFIFATHLHELSHNKRITELENVKQFHLTVEYDAENDKLVYTRKLKEGSGPSSYGIEVAKAMGLPKDTIDLAMAIREEITAESNELVSSKKSRYNNSKILDCCEICKTKVGTSGKNSVVKSLHTHHINFQCNVDSGTQFHKAIHKNHPSNLIGVCESCHQAIHRDEIIVKGYFQTFSGIELIWEKNEKVNTVNK